MCWIWIVPKNMLCDLIENQVDRWLHSMWILDFQKKTLFTWVKHTIWWYQEFIEESVDEDSLDLCLMHHRKASIGRLSLDNAHPFIWKKFILAQNGTSKEFFDEVWKDYGKETDSETLLMYLEDMCDSLDDCIDALDEIDSVLWIIMIVHKDKILIYSDSCRWSYVDIIDTDDEEWNLLDSYLVSFTNYKPWSTSLEYRNGFYMIIDSKSWKIEKEWNYDKDYNDTRWYTYAWQWDIKSKKTRKILDLAKKKPIVGWSHSKSCNKSNPLFWMNDDEDYWKQYEETIVDESKNIVINNKSKSRIYMKQAKKTMTLAEHSKMIIDLWNSVIFEDLEYYTDIRKLLTEYEITKWLNAKTEIELCKNLHHFTNDEINYDHIYNIAYFETFNRRLTWAAKRQIDILFLVPPELLIWIFVTHDLYIQLNLVRHTKILWKLTVDEVIPYFDWLNYFFTTLKAYDGTTKLELVNDIRTLDSFMRIEHWLIINSEEVKWFWSYWEDRIDMSEWFILAWFALWFKAKDLNVKQEYFNSLTTRN